MSVHTKVERIKGEYNFPDKIIISDIDVEIVLTINQARKIVKTIDRILKEGGKK